MTPVGKSDHCVVFSEYATPIRRCQPKPREILQFSKVNWTKLNEDISKLHNKILQQKDSHSTEELCYDFISSLSLTPSEKQLVQANLPWMTNDLWRKINKLDKKAKCKKIRQK